MPQTKKLIVECTGFAAGGERLEQHHCAVPVYNNDREASGHGLSAETVFSLTGFAVRLSVGGDPERSCDSYIVSFFIS